MKMKTFAGLAFLLNTMLYGSYYSIAKGVLGRVDPIVFTFFTMMTLVPPAILIIACSWRKMTRASVRGGFILGSCLCLGLFTLAVALKYNSATGTAFFPSLNGLLAAIFTWLFLRRPIGKATWLAGIISVGGAILLMANASMGGLRGALIAFIGGIFCSSYVFLADHEQKDQSPWPLFGVELLTMALWANLLALLFGDWSRMQFVMPEDVGAVLYIGLGTMFLPILITVLLQRYISPVTVSFISILEPMLGALVAYLYLHEVISFNGYLGGGLVVIGVLIHTLGTVRQDNQSAAVQQQLPALHQLMGNNGEVREAISGDTWRRALLYPLLCCAVGIIAIYKFGGFPFNNWSSMRVLNQISPTSGFLPQLVALFQQGQATTALLIIAYVLCWLLAWGAILGLAALALYRGIRKINVGRASSAQEHRQQASRALADESTRPMPATTYPPYMVRPAMQATRSAYATSSYNTSELRPGQRSHFVQEQAPTRRGNPVTRQLVYQDAFGKSWSWDATFEKAEEETR
jgi:drug/metabolite transporter (DMT)-like permease